MMFSESCNDRRRRGRRSPQGSRQRRRDRRWLRRNWRWRRRDRRYRHERDPMLNSVLNGDWSNSVLRRQIPEGDRNMLYLNKAQGHARRGNATNERFMLEQNKIMSI